MGLGKTIQAIGIINATPEIRRVLIICPASLKINWKRELEKWLVRPMMVGIANGTFPETDIVIINYELLAKHRAAIDAIQWDLASIDEAHYLKNPKALRTRLVLGRWDKDPQKIVQPIRARARLFLTGTPLVNKPVELWPLVQATNAAGMGRTGFLNFAKRYCDAKRVRVSSTKTVWDFTGSSNLPELQERLRSSVMIRRLKQDVLDDLPAKRRQIMVMPVSDPSLRATLEAEIKAYDSLEEAPLSERTAAFTALSDLRHRTALAKVPLALDYIREVLESVEKLVVWAHHRDVVTALRDALADYGAVSLTGEDSMPDRQAAVDRFQADKSCRVFVGSIQAAGVGLTLTAAQTAVFCELDWVPGNMSQAEDRLHRIGQRGSVLIQHLVLDDSLDARMARIVVEKQAVLDATLDNAVETSIANPTAFSENLPESEQPAAIPPVA